MRFSDRLAVVVLLAMGALLVVGNLWFTAARSTIPLSIDGRVVACEVRHEKHPGVDDVCLVTLEDGRVLHVDRPLFDSVDEGQVLQKAAWQRSLDCDGNVWPLDWSADARGMWPAMAVACVALAGVSAWIVARR